MSLETTIQKALPAAVGATAIAALAAWLVYVGSGRLQERVPGSDGAPIGAAAGESGPWKGRLIPSNGVPAAFSGIWNQFRGPNRNAICLDPTPLAKTWPAAGPKVAWKLGVGEGYAGGVIWKGRVLLLDYDKAARADALRSLSLADGREIWRYTYPVKLKSNHGLSRTIPTIVGNLSISLGPKCNVVCVDAASGEFKWQLDMVKEFGAQVPEWYAGQCPFVDGNKLILGAGGPEALMVAVDIETGKTLWKSPNPNQWRMTHSSVAPMDFKGRREYLYCANGGVVAVSAEDGAILWQYPGWKINLANIPTPLVIPGDRIFLCGGYDAGSQMLQVKEENGQQTVTPLYKLPAKVFGATQHTPIVYKDHLFGVRADDQLVCLDFDGKVVWASGVAHKFGKGPFLIAQDMIFVMDDDGTLTLAEASTEKFNPLAQAKVLEGPDAWAPMALADGFLVLRDMNQMICLDIRAQ